MVDRPPDAEERPETSRLSVNIEDVDLPVEEEAREQLLAEVRDDIETALAENDLSAGETSVQSGHQYTGIAPDCPRCGSTLALPRPFTIEKKLTSTAQMSITCRNCGYGGGATYRLVDINTNKLIPGRPSHKQAETSRSEVTDGKISPEYSAYHG